MKAGTESKGKFKRLKRRLNVPMYQVVGILEAMWMLTVASAQDGGIGRLSNEDIAAALEWSGNENELIAVLIECDWLDPYPDDEIRFVVHDWQDHVPGHIKANFVKYGKKFLVSPKRLARLAKDAASGDSIGDSDTSVPKDGAINSIQFNSIQETPPPNPTGARKGTPSGGVSGVGVGGDFWKSAREATERIGLTSAGFARLHAKCTEKGISPAEVEMACRHAASGRYDNPPGALASWVGVHELNRAVDDKRSWPANGHEPSTSKPPTPEQTRSSIEFEAVRLAKAGKAKEAAALLELHKIPREQWPIAVTAKLEEKA